LRNACDIKPRLHPHRRHAHLAFEFGLRHQRGDGINHDDVERVRARERFANGQRLFAGIRLRHEQIVQVHAEFFCVGGIERVLGVNERRESAGFLRVGDDVEHQRRFAGRFRPVNFNHASARNAADAEREVERERAGRDDADFDFGLRVAEAHDRAVAVAFVDAGNGGFQFAGVRGRGLRFGGIFFDGFFSGFGGHKIFGFNLREATLVNQLGIVKRGLFTAGRICQPANWDFSRWRRN
jgi:hypothetical protein